MQYPTSPIADSSIPDSRTPLVQEFLSIYAGETNKVHSVWTQFSIDDMDFTPHARSASVGAIMEHQLLSERRFFADFLGSSEPPPADVLPRRRSPSAMARRLVRLARPRLAFLAAAPEQYWFERTTFFDVQRTRVWIFWRRILHTAHHRTQLSVYLRLLDKPVPPTYGPTADVSWIGADPTLRVER